MRRRDKATANLDDVVELLNGLGTTLMTISSKLDAIITLLGGEDEGPDA